MDSNVNSFGVPVDHDGEPLEDGAFVGRSAPFAIRGDVFRELFMEPEHFGGSHLETDPSGKDVKAMGCQSSLVGGIPIERVDIEDVDEGYQSEESLPPVENSHSNPTSATIHAVLKTSQHERDALYASRKKLFEVLAFLRSKGFSEEDVLQSSVADGFGHLAPKRDDFGFPVPKVTVSDPFKDKLKGKVDVDPALSDAKQVFDGLPNQKPSGNSMFTNSDPKVFAEQTKGSEHSGEKDAAVSNLKSSWVNVVKKDVTPAVKFQYYPLESGTSIVQPPDDVLKKGNAKFLNCIVGTFSKGTLSFKSVSDFAFQAWKSRGLTSVSQKDLSTFVFRFENEVGMNDVLSRGTWYINRRPMIVTAWGTKPGLSSITTMPLWVKFSNVPECYWTEEGLARLASVVGEPIGADAQTSKLELLPFAKMQVKYRLGDPLPNDFQVVVLDPVTEVHSLAKVTVTYPSRPLSCSGCKSLGHSISACPSTTRIWKVKEKSVENVEPSAPSGPVLSSSVPSIPEAAAPSVLPSGSEDGWTDVKRKKPGNLSDFEASPSPPVTFKNLKVVDEIAAKHRPSISGNVVDSKSSPKRLTKSQKKKLKASLGGPSLS